MAGGYPIPFPMDHPSFPARSTLTESMDDPSAGADVIRSEYRFLARLNRATRAVESLAEEIERRGLHRGGRPVRVVDFGSGGGDIPRRLVAQARRRGWEVQALCTDRREPGPGPSARSPGEPLEFRRLDVLEGPERLGRGGHDVAHASLVLHHLGDRDVVRALRAMADVATGLVVWNDLVRDRIGVAGAWLSTLGARAELRRDAVTSVRRGFTLDEALAAAEAAGLLEVRIRRVRGARFVLSGTPGPAPVAGRPLVRADGVTVRYGPRTALADVSLVVHAGEVLMVEGPNGAGKSTLLGCLVGARVPCAGTAWRDRSGAPVGFHPQDGGLFPALDVAANLATFARAAGMRAPAREAAVREALARFGLDAHASMPVTRLSGGLRRRAALAACLVHRPSVAVLDEPDAGLDAAGHEALIREIDAIAARGGAVVVASHAPERFAGSPSAVRRHALRP